MLQFGSWKKLEEISKKKNKIYIIPNPNFAL